MRIDEHGLDKAFHWRACRFGTFTCRILVLSVVQTIMMRCPTERAFVTRSAPQVSSTSTVSTPHGLPCV